MPDVQVLVRVVREGVQGVYREQQQVQEHGEAAPVPQGPPDLQPLLSGYDFDYHISF